MQQRPRRWPGFDKRVETKLRWDVYIRPWPPGWSFLRRIYTSRGSERVKFHFFYTVLKAVLKMERWIESETENIQKALKKKTIEKDRGIGRRKKGTDIST